MSHHPMINHREPYEMAVVFLEHERPTAPWIIGQAADGDQQYIMHVAAPTFLAKIARGSDEGVLSGTSYATSDDHSLYDLIWFDEVPDQVTILDWMSKAEQAIRMCERSATEID